MKLLTLILKQTELISELTDELGEIGVKHGTIIDAKSMTAGLNAWSDDSIIMGGLFRRVKNFEYNEECKMLMFVLEDEQVASVRQKINEVIGDISQSGTSVMFTMPIDFAEGLGEQESITE